MAPTTKQSLINYLEFLKENGYLYAEGVDVEALAQEAAGAMLAPAAPNASAPPAPAMVQTAQHSVGPQSAPAMQPATRSTARPAAAHSPVSSRAAAPDAGADLFGGAPPAAPARQAAARHTATHHAAPVCAMTPDWNRLAGISVEEKARLLADGAARAEACRACALGAQRNKLVYKDGPPEARLLFVGEAPGGEEDLQGLPFVGAAGQLLNKMIAAIGLKREEVFICNTLKCRPPQNRDPQPEEKAACEHFLIEQLEIMRPALMVALGAHAAHYLCRSEESIGRMRGRWHDYHGVPLLVTYHPAFLLRNASFKPKSWEDFQAIHAKYSELFPDDPRPLWSKKENSS